MNSNSRYAKVATSLIWKLAANAIWHPRPSVNHWSRVVGNWARNATAEVIRSEIACVIDVESVRDTVAVQGKARAFDANC
jgi:hypothetical protein